MQFDMGFSFGTPRAGAAPAASVETTLFTDPLTADTSVTEREPDASWSYGANGATMPDSGGFHQVSLSWGTKNAAHLLPDPATIADGKFSSLEVQCHNETSNPQQFVHVYADATTVNSVQDSFCARADGTNIKIFKRVAASDSELATAASAFTDLDRLKLVVTKNGSGWDVAAYKNDALVCSATGQTHAGTLGRYAMYEAFNAAGDTETVKNAIGITDGA